MSYAPVDAERLNELREMLGADWVESSGEALQDAGRDMTEDLCFPPEAVVYPANTGEVSRVLAWANAHLIPVTPRGAGTGLSGGALPVKGGIVLGLKRLNRILEIDTKNFTTCVEPGVINEELQQAVWEKGLFYPPDPASKGSCFLGGNIAHSSGGPRALKYGTTKDFVLNLEVVLASGEIIQTGAQTLKNSTGLNLTQLMVGSEGLLGVVTKIWLRLLPAPIHNTLLFCFFKDAETAATALNAVFTQKIMPSAAELMTRNAFETALKFRNESFDYPQETQCFLLFEFDGHKPEEPEAQAMQAAEVLYEHGALDVMPFDTSEKKENLWRIRRCIGEAAKTGNVYKEEDTVVPRAALPELLSFLEAWQQKWNVRTVTYGHAGDGNLHINILKDELSDDYWHNTLPNGIHELFETVTRLGGTISGEHGIGYVQRPYLKHVFNETHIQLMRGIKDVFDPKGILNPGKVYLP